MNLNIKENFLSLINEGKKNKKYILFYSIFLLIIFLSFLSLENFLAPVKEILLFLFVFIIGIFCLTFYFSDREIHKTAFILILCIGLCLCFLTPIGIISDEPEHYNRAQITSAGNFFPEYNQEHQGFKTIEDTRNVKSDMGHTYFNSDIKDIPINQTVHYQHSAFQQNPFYGYLTQSLGIIITELLNLSSIWAQWLGRIFTLILYAGLISFAIKKSPILKVPLFAMACMPQALFQAASLSIDALINGLAFIVIAYFFYFLKTENIKIGKKKLFIFSSLVLLLGLCKVTFFALFLLIFLVPRSKFENKYYGYSFLILILLVVVSVLWSKFYAVPGVYHSFRQDYFIRDNINPSLQTSYLLNHIPESLVMLANFPNYFSSLFINTFNFALNQFMFGSVFINGIYPLFLGAVILLYPNNNKISNKVRIGVLLICVIIFYGTYIIQLLTWTPVGQLSPILGVQFRYFIPLFGLLPFCLGFNNKTDEVEKVNNIIIILTILFLEALLFLTFFRWY